MIGLYIHFPFCAGKCPYCDFYSVNYNKYLAREYAEAVIRNIEYYNIKHNISCDTVYFGGGTPTLAYKEIRGILKFINCSRDAEITVEANPLSLSDESAALLRNSGINRVSVGVQSLSEYDLKFLGRKHSPQEAINAVNMINKTGIKNISVDLMLGTPYQTVESVKETIKQITGLPITHVSVYMLKIEPNTAFAKNNFISSQLLDEEKISEIYLAVVENLAESGFIQYEISNFAKSGFKCAHNLKYWRHEQYLGIGAAAHSFYKTKRFGIPRDIKAFIKAKIQQEIAITSEHDPGDFSEYAMLKLRLTEGLTFKECEKFKIPKQDLLNKMKLIPPEYLNITDYKFSITPKGFLVSNSVIGKLIFN